MSLGSSSSSTTKGNWNLNASISEKLTRDKFLMGKAHVLSDICGAQLEEFLDGSTPASEKELKAKDKDDKEVTIPNPEYACWIA
jgi:hypothetical protein